MTPRPLDSEQIPTTTLHYVSQTQVQASPGAPQNRDRDPKRSHTRRHRSSELMQ